MLARACSITARFFLPFTFVGATVIWSSRIGRSGGVGALLDLWPMDASFPVLNRCTASRVRWTCGNVSKEK